MLIVFICSLSENVSGLGPGPVQVPGPGLGPVPVPEPVISGPDDWSRSRFRLKFDPGTGPGPNPCPVAWLLKYSYKKCTEILAITSKLESFRLFVIVLLQLQI